jgi:hypothetical protein
LAKLFCHPRRCAEIRAGVVGGVALISEKALSAGKQRLDQIEFGDFGELLRRKDDRPVRDGDETPP